MRILVVSSFFPYPLHAGGYIRLYNLMKELSKYHEITLIAEKRSKQTVTPEYIKELKKICKKVIVVPTRKQWSWQNILKAGVSPYPFLLTGHTSKQMKQEIINMLKEKTFDLIHVETFYVMQNLPKTYLPVVLAEHNIEYQVYRKYIDVAPLPIRPLLLAEIQKIKYWENKFWKKATKLIAVSKPDKNAMGREDTVIVANGVDLNNFKYQASNAKFQMKEKRILFMGDFKWLQNREAAQRIINEIWPLIQSSIVNSKSSINLKLWIVGKHIPEDIKAMKGKNIIFDENAPDETSKIYKNSYMLLSPIQIGGGTSYKILESMASGVPVVTTELGVKGLSAKHGKEALVGDTAEKLAGLALSLLEDKSKYEKITKQARILIEENYSWDRITTILEKVYQDAVTL